MKKAKAFHWILVVALSAGAGIILWYFVHQGPSPSNYLTVKVTRGDIENTVTAVGILQPSYYVDVGAQVSGQLKSLRTKMGDFVKRGDLLAEVDPTLYSTRVMEATATLENLQSQLKMKEVQHTLTSKQYMRNISLLKENAISVSEAEKSETSYKTTEAEIEALRAQIKQAEANLETTRANLNYTKIVAPLSGTVVSIYSREGQTLNANQQTPIILRIADMNTMTVWAQVSEADISRLRIGQEVYFTLIGQPEKRWISKLKQIFPTPEIINNATFYNALLDVSNPKQELKVQMTAQVFFVIEKAENALMVPVSALQPIERKNQNQAKRRKEETRLDKRRLFIVRVIQKDGSVEEGEVTVGVMDGVSAEIVSGLQEGERVITGMGTLPKESKKAKGLDASKKGGRL